MREIIATGKDTEQAIEAGFLELNVAREDVKIEIHPKSFLVYFL